MLAIEAVLSGIALPDARRRSVLAGLEPSGLPSEVHVLSVLVGLALLATAPRLWRGTRTAVSLAILGLTALAMLNVVKGRWGEAAVELSLAALLAGARGAFPLGCRNRPRVAMVATAVGAWGLAYCALRVAPLVHGRAHGLVHALHRSVTHALRLAAGGPQMTPGWSTMIDILIACAAVSSGLAVRSLLRPAAAENHHVEHEYRAARAIVDAHGEDSLSPFLLRPDKALQFGAGGVLSYRVIRGVAVVSSDPVGPPGAAPRLLASFLELAHRHGWQVALWGASDRHLDAYRELGLHAVCVGEEAFVDPRRFTLEGRAVRKLRQSVNRVQRRGWEVVVREGRAVDAELEAEIDALEREWRSGRRRLYGFAMGMGGYDTELRPDDLYVLARSPSGELGAAMRFVSHCGKLSLDTMRRVGLTPNGLNEALVCRALEVAREVGVTQVSLNYAGLAHLVRGTPPAGRLQRWGGQVLLAALGHRFQMERLVRFNEKFNPEWRPRYLVYESQGALPRAVVRVLQAEGYLPERGRLPLPRSRVALPGALGRSPHAPGAG